MIRRLPILVLCTLAPAQVTPELADRIKIEGLQNSRVMLYLDQLTNGIGHRLTGSDNFQRACEWARAEFEKMGLDARLEQWGEWKVSWNRGQWQGRVLEPAPLELQVATDAWTAGTKGLQRGAVVKMPTAVEEIDTTVAGKWLISRRLPRSGLEEAQKFGALGVVYSSRGDRQHPDRIRVFGSYRTPRRDLPRICVRADQFEALWELVEAAETGAGKAVRAEFDIRNRFRTGKVPLYNVVADLKGSEHPDEQVIVCGHLDSWHQASGTTDNGTGTTTTMEAARILSAVGARPRRTIRFILWGGEEQGLLGSTAYVRRHRSAMDKVSCVFNHDTGTNWAYSLRVTDSQYDDMSKIVAPVLTMTAPDADHSGPVFRLSKVRSLGRGGGSDHASFLAVGVPAFPWGLRGRSDYFRYTWHSQWDTYDEAIPEYQRHTSTVVALTALGAANLPHLLGRGGVGRAQPKADAKPIAEARLGVELEDLTVAGIDKAGVAQAAGIRSGDKIVAVDGTRLASVVDLVAALRDNKPPWAVTVERAGKEIGVMVDGK